MRRILLSKGTVRDAEGTTEQLIKSALDQVPEGGFNYKEYKKRARIENAMDKVETDMSGPVRYFELEDNDYYTLRELVRKTPWATRDKFLIDFVSQFEE
jgi:hypothetical protein